MKLSVSVPDELWATVHSAGGASETVQRALRLLEQQQRQEQRPMANAPTDDIGAYTPAFENAVRFAAHKITAVLDRGYRFGLGLASNMTTSDFEALDRETARAELQEIFNSWGEPATALGDFSWEFAEFIEHVLNQDPIELGGPDDEVPGVRWMHRDEGEGFFPVLSDTFADGVLAALRDVRDEAVRRLGDKGKGQ